MSQSHTQTKRPLLSSRAKVAIGIGIIAILAVLAFFAPPEGETGNVTADPATTPTLIVTHLVDSVMVNRSVDFDGVHFTISKVMEATKFSDDRKRTGTYTVRVLVQTKNSGQTPIGIDYASLVHLVSADGTVIPPKYISLEPVSLPDRPQNGFFDFPVSSQVALSSLTLRLGDDTTVPFGG